MYRIIWGEFRLKRRTAEERMLKASALFEKEKAGILWLLRHKNPG